MRSQWSSLNKKLHPKTKKLKKSKAVHNSTHSLEKSKKGRDVITDFLKCSISPLLLFSLSPLSSPKVFMNSTKTLVCIPSGIHSHPIQWLPFELDNCKKCLPTWDPPCHAPPCANFSYSEFIDCFIRIFFFPVYLCVIKSFIFSSWVWTQGLEKIRGGERRGRTRNQPQTATGLVAPPVCSLLTSTEWFYVIG